VKELLQHADRTPVTLLIALAYGTLLVLTDPFGRDGAEFGKQLEAYGWLTPKLAADGEAWRMLSSAFLHGGIVHVLFNLAMLFAIGPALELSLGSLRYLVLYVVAALGGSIAVCLFYDIHQPVVGGSGALFGMMGALLAINMRSGRHLFSFLDFEGPRRLIGMIVVNLVIGWLLPMVSNTAHIGGLIAGFLVTFLWLRPGREVTVDLRRWRSAGVALFLSLLFASLMPVTRYDWLLRQARQAEGETAMATMRALVTVIEGQPPAGNDDDVRMRFDAYAQKIDEGYEPLRR